MGISRILGILGILKCDSSSKNMDYCNNEISWNYWNIWNIQTFTETLPTQTPVE